MRDKVQKWCELQSVRLSLLWYSVARRKQQENSLQQVKSGRDSPLAFSPIASRPRSFSYLPKMARNAKCAFFVFMALGRARQARFHGTRSRTASSRRNTQLQVGSARASPLAFSLIASRPRRFYPSLHLSP